MSNDDNVNDNVEATEEPKVKLPRLPNNRKIKAESLQQARELIKEDFIVNINGSCIPGFEHIAIAECQQRLGITATLVLRGRLSLLINALLIPKLFEMRSMHHYWVVVEEQKFFFTQFADDVDGKSAEFIEKLTKLPAELEWENPLIVWKMFKLLIDEKDYSGVDAPHAAENQLSFRTTAYRTGKHEFTSMDVACHLGGGVNDALKWKVDLTSYDVEVVVHVLDQGLSIGVQLTNECLSLRNITHFGPTNLRASICYCLLKLANVKPGDVVCDPMCGGGSISLEGSCSVGEAFHLAGDIHNVAVMNSRDNMHDLEHFKEKSLPISVAQWDIYRLPLRTGSIDHIVTDLPFGKKIGSRERNMFLYPVALREMARVCAPGGTGVFLTQHKAAIWKAIKCIDVWSVDKIHGINMGGMKVSVFVLRRNPDKLPKNEQVDGGPVKVTNDDVKQTDKELLISHEK